MTSEERTNEIQDPTERIRARLPALAQTLEGAQNALPTILQLPSKQRAREAYRWYMLLAEETELFLEELYKHE